MKKNKIMIAGKLVFNQKKHEDSFLSLSKVEKEEFQKDLASMCRGVRKEMKKSNIFIGHAVANQRFTTNRYFKQSLSFDFTNHNKPLIYVDEFLELDIDEYLDSINSESENLDNGYVELKIK